MVVIDYLGFRLLATSLLPIGPATIVYGSSDACKTLHFDEEAADELKAVAAVLNLKVRSRAVPRTPALTPTYHHLAPPFAAGLRVLVRCPPLCVSHVFCSPMWWSRPRAKV
jgi:hypothetical protein